MTYFSIIIPTYNRAKSVCKAIESVLAQPYEDFEIIVVDDGSTDDTKLFLKQKYGERINYVFQENSGVCAARNHGAELANGKYLIFLDSDDYFTDNVLFRYHKSLKNSQAKLVKGVVNWEDNVGDIVRRQMPKLKGQTLTEAFAIETIFFRNIGGYDPNLTYAENSDLFLRVTQSGENTNLDIHLIDDEGVCIPFEDNSSRKARYVINKKTSIKYFLEKHKDFFNKHPRQKVNFQRVLARSYLALEQYGKARNIFLKILVNNPLSFVSIYQFLLVLAAPRFAKTYYNR